MSRIERREGLGAILTITRFCNACGYSDGFVHEIDPDGLIERDAARRGDPYVLGSPRG